MKPTHLLLFPILLLPACGPDFHIGPHGREAELLLAEDSLLLDGRPVASFGPAGFINRPFAHPDLPELMDVLTISWVSHVTIRVEDPDTRPLTALELRTVLAEFEAAGLTGWSLEVGQEYCGRVSILIEPPEVRACDLTFGASFQHGVHHLPVQSLHRQIGPPARRVHLELDLSTPIPLVCDALSRVDGDEIRLFVHSGPY